MQIHFSNGMSWKLKKWDQKLLRALSARWCYHVSPNDAKHILFLPDLNSLDEQRLHFCSRPLGSTTEAPTSAKLYRHLQRLPDFEVSLGVCKIAITFTTLQTAFNPHHPSFCHLFGFHANWNASRPFLSFFSHSMPQWSGLAGFVAKSWPIAAPRCIFGIRALINLQDCPFQGYNSHWCSATSGWNLTLNGKVV